jgi:iron complex outermembrane receptor protein
MDVEVPFASSDMKLRFHLDANYADPQYSFQAESVKSQSSFIVNGRISLADIALTNNGTRATLSVWSRNLFNEDHIYRLSGANESVIGDYGNFNPPRTFGVEGTVNF